VQKLGASLEKTLQGVAEFRHVPKTQHAVAPERERVRMSQPATLRLSSLSLALIGGTGALSPLFLRGSTRFDGSHKQGHGKQWERSTSMFSDDSDDDLPSLRGPEIRGNLRLSGQSARLASGTRQRQSGNPVVRKPKREHHCTVANFLQVLQTEMAYAMGEIEELLGLALTVRAESRLQRQQTARLRSESSSPPPNLSHESRLSLSPIGSQPDGHLCAIQRRLDETLAALDAAQTAYDQAQSELADTRRLLNATELALVQAQQQAAVAASPASAKQPPGNCIDDWQVCALPDVEGDTQDQGQLWAFRRGQQVAMEALLREPPGPSASSLASENEEGVAMFELKRLARTIHLLRFDLRHLHWRKSAEDASSLLFPDTVAYSSDDACDLRGAQAAGAAALSIF